MRVRVCVRVHVCVCGKPIFLSLYEFTILHSSQNLEQEKFSLQQKLEAQKSTSVVIQQEFETTCVQLEQKFTQQLKYSEEVNSRKIHELTKANSDLKAENEKLEVISHKTNFIHICTSQSQH